MKSDSKLHRFLILIHGDDQVFASLPPEVAQEMIALLQPFEETVAREGRLIGTHRLMPAAGATLVQIRGGKRSITDGPFTETKEQLGGYYLVEAHDEQRWFRLFEQSGRSL